MNSKRTLIIIGGLVVALLLAYLFWNSKKEAEAKNAATQSPVPEDHSTVNSSSVPGDQTVGNPTSQNQNSQYFKLVAMASEGAEGKKKALQEAFNSPIDFWGKVVDQDGQPVAGATVTLTVNNTPDPYGNLPKVTVLSDANGLFSLTGKNGLGLAVWASKDGYYSTSTQSAISLNYSLKGGVNQPFPTQEHPSVLVLKKKGKPAALVHKRLHVSVPKDGTPVEINLTQGRAVAAGQGDLKVEAWAADHGRDVSHPFDWKCQVMVLGGGLQTRTGELDFTAPADGYQSQEQVTMQADAPQWNGDMDRDYFLKLSNGSYVRMKFSMINGGDHFLALDYYLNPAQGDRNLEYDPAQQIKTK